MKPGLLKWPARLLAGVLLVGSLPAVQADGGKVGNGGFIIRCKKDPALNSFEGDYFLDYIATYVVSNKNSDIVQLKTWEDYRDRILNGLLQKAPEMGQAFQEYLSTENNFSDYAQKRIWVEKSFGLEPQDPELFDKVPKNCRTATDKADYSQFIRRSLSGGGDQIIYEFDPAYHEPFKQNRPLQFSFAKFHEFAWDYTDDINVVRTLNRLVHSKQFDQYSPTEFQKALSKIGVNLSADRTGGTGYTKSHLDEQLLQDIERGNLDFVRLWLKQGASPNARKENGMTALMMAVYYRQNEIVKLLLDRKAFTEPKDGSGTSAMTYALAQRDRTAFDLLVAAGASVPRNCLLSVVNAGANASLLQACVDAKAANPAETFNSDALYIPDSGAISGSGMNAIALLLKQKGDPSKIQFLVEKAGVDVQTVTRTQNVSGLMMAMSYLDDDPQYSLQAVKALLNVGARADAQDAFGNIVLHYYRAFASMTSDNMISSYDDIHLEILDRLMAAGADPKLKNSAGNLALKEPGKYELKGLDKLNQYVYGKISEVTGQSREDSSWFGCSLSKKATQAAVVDALKSCQVAGLSDCKEAPEKKAVVAKVDVDKKTYCQTTAWAVGKYFPAPPVFPMEP